MVRLAAPVLMEEFLTLLVGWTDLWLVGQFVEGEPSKAAMGLMSYVMWLIPSMFAAVSIGTVALVSRMQGAGTTDRGNLFANQALATGILFAVLASLLSWNCYPAFVRSMNLSGESADYAMRYLSIVIPVIPLIMIQQVGVAAFRGAGDTLSGLMVKSLVVVLNMAVSVLCVTGVGWFPRLGFDGVALGTAVGHGLGGLCILFLLIRGRAGIRLRPGWLVPRWNPVKRLLRVGLPGGFDIAAVLICQLVFLSLVNGLGTLEAASHAVAIQIEAVSYLPGTAFQVAVATMAGQFLGARMPIRAMKSVWTCTWTGMAVMTASGILVFLFADSIAGFFIHSSDHGTIELAAELLRIICWAMPALALVMILSGALRGAGDTRWPFVITLLGFLVIRIPLAQILAHPSIPIGDWQLTGFGLGIHGAWYAMVIDLVCRALMLLARTLHGGWLRAVV